MGRSCASREYILQGDLVPRLHCSLHCSLSCALGLFCHSPGHTSPKDPSLAPQVLLQDSGVVWRVRAKQNWSIKMGGKEEDVVFRQWDLNRLNLGFVPKHSSSFRNLWSLTRCSVLVQLLVWRPLFKVFNGMSSLVVCPGGTFTLTLGKLQSDLNTFRFPSKLFLAQKLLLRLL